MKQLKKLSLTLVAILGMTGAWAQDTDDNVAVTKTANNNEWTLMMPASDVELEVEYYATTPFDLTVGENEHGTVTFTVGGETTDKACYADVVTVTVAPNEGYSAKDVTVRAYTSWDGRTPKGFPLDVQHPENGAYARHGPLCPMERRRYVEFSLLFIL